METLNRQTAADVAHCLRTISDPNRLLMMKLLERKEYCVCQFVVMFGISQPAVSQHLRKLREAGLVKEDRRGQWRYYSLDDASIHAPMTSELLAHISEEDSQLLDLLRKEQPVDCC
ncbi:MAG TPA: metalloregulator ArsR/SmtB family transcription factor [Planococcus sp. (in: firmicutes)]|nr:metalloregulator ArsR/SmtB family transcription factor [Planococcus sp. (in: firmicutes)]